MGALEIVDQVMPDDDHCFSSDHSYSIINQRTNDDENEFDRTFESDIFSDGMDLLINQADADNQTSEF